MAKITRLAASDIAGTNKVGFDFEIKSDAGTLTTANANHEIQILPAGGMVFSYDSGDLFEPFEPIVSSTLDLSFFATHDDQLSDIVAMNRAGEKATYIKVRMWKNASVEQFWYGVLVPEETTYEVTEGRTLVRMKFADGLKMLGGYELKDNTTGDLIEGWKTFLDYANTILRKIPWVDEELSGVDNLIRETPFFELKDWYDSVGYTFASEGGMLRKEGVLAETFYKDKGKSSDGRRTTFGETIGCDEVLENICINLGYKLCWNGETFHFFSPLNYSDAQQGQISHDSILYLRDQSGSQTGTYDAFEPEWNADADTKLMNGAVRRFSNCYNEAIVTHKSNISSNIIGPQSGLNTESTQNNVSTFASKDVPDYRIDAGGKLTLRVAATVDQKYGGTGFNTPNRHYIYYAKCQLKVGSYYLSAPAQAAAYQDALELINAGGANNKIYPCQQKDLPQAFWTTTPSYIDIPMSVGYSYMTPTADEHLDGLNFIPHSVQHDGEGNYSVDNNRNLIRMDYTLVTPELPANSTGIEFKHGLGWSQNIQINSDGGNTIYNYNQILQAGAFSALFNTDEVIGYHNQTAFLYEGEQSDNPIYSTLNSSDDFVEVLDLGDVLVGPRLNRSGNAGYISSATEAGGYTFDAEYTTPADRVSAIRNNLQILTEEWYRLGGLGMEGLEGDFMFNHDTAQTFIPWADSVFSTGCILGNFLTADLLINSFSYDLVGPMQISAFVVDRDAGVSVADGGRPETGTGRPTPPTIDGRTQAGGGTGVSPTDLEDANQDNQILSFFLSRNNP